MNARIKSILVVDDESSMRHMLRLVLEREGYRVAEAENGETALACLRRESFDVVLCDVRMPEMNGMDFLQRVKDRATEGPMVIMMSAYGSIDSAVECMKMGAYDYFSKPFRPDEVILTLRKAEERLSLQQENKKLKEALARKSDGSLVFRSAAMERIAGLVKQVAGAASPILISGETGTGKELVARALHAGSHRQERPFVAVNCSAISAGLMESELFGHARGAFTGADRDHSGLFGAAEGGTLFLDEIAEMPLELQPKLLRVLQEGEVRRVGETAPRRFDVRVLAATAKDLKGEVASGGFREDLYFRLAVIDIFLPPLRERPEDIPVLAEYFLERIAGRENRPVPALAPDAIELLLGYAWPGNVRELSNFMEKTLIFCRAKRIGAADLPAEIRRRNRQDTAEFSLRFAVPRMEREYIRKALAAAGGNRTQAARLLEISLRGLLYKMKEYGIR